MSHGSSEQKLLSPTLLSPTELSPLMTGSDVSTPTADSSTGDLPKSPTRRQTASTYPTLRPQKPFSRSAAKRESVMMLGSIEHLQHYFTKTGLAAPTNPFKPNSGAAPAIGGLQLTMQPPIINLPEGRTLPPTPVIPSRPNIEPPRVVTQSYSLDPESLKPGVIDDIVAMCVAWAIDTSKASSFDPPSSPGAPPSETGSSSSGVKIDVLNVLKTTTQTVRSVRNYLVALPDDSVTHIREDYRSKIASAPARRRPRSSDPGKPSTNDPLALIRRCALEVLAVLRELEELARLPLEDDAYDAGSDGGGSAHGPPSRVASPNNMSTDLNEPILHHDPDSSFAFSLVKVRGRAESVPVWEDEEAEFNVEPEAEPRERWDERLVLQSGWLYRQDLSSTDLEHEQSIIAHYVDTVDEVLFGGRRGGMRGWEFERAKLARRERSETDLRKARRDSEGPPGDSQPRGRAGRRIVSAGMLDTFKKMAVTEEPEGADSLGAVTEETEAIFDEDEEIPGWAQPDAFPSNLIGRAHALLIALLPEQLRPHLPPAPASRTQLLTALASGQLLCEAYNVGVRRSRKPWGYVGRHSIHDLVTLEASSLDAGDAGSSAGTRGWTFRRVDNLRIWAAALKLRYMLPIITPAQAAGGKSPAIHPAPLPISPSVPKFSSPEPPFLFDALLVARKDEGWEDMLGEAVERWTQAVAEERRGDR